MKASFLQKIKDRKGIIGVIGMGYVGLPLAIEFGKAGFSVIGFDVDQNKVDKLNRGDSYIRHIPAQAIADLFCKKSQSAATVDFELIKQCDALLICVPTPLTNHRDPDMTYVESTARAIAPHLREGQLITLESTTYPGTTEEVLIPLLEAGSKLKAGTDYMVAYSPEREDPNNTQFSTATIPKVVGGLTPDSLETACALYETVICRTVPVANCRTAEATKLMENIFRCINIALVNELKIVFTAMGIDIWEVINAAATKPFGYMPFYPGPGLGGHCIPIDPFYLTWKAREYGIATRFIELAGEINTSMPEYVVYRTMHALNDRGKALSNSHVLLVGLAYKKNVDDDRESPTYALWKKLEACGAAVEYYDPFCPVIRPSRAYPDLAGIKSKTWREIENGSFDVAIISTAHDNVDHESLVKSVPLVVDTRGICQPAENVIKA